MTVELWADASAGGMTGRRGSSSIWGTAAGDDPRATAGMPGVGEEPPRAAVIAGEGVEPAATAGVPPATVLPWASAVMPAVGLDPCARAALPVAGVDPPRTMGAGADGVLLPLMNGGIPATAPPRAFDGKEVTSTPGVELVLVAADVGRVRPARALGMPIRVSARRASASRARPAALFSSGSLDP